ncbi:MAG: serine/threonine-protein kinase [Thermoanaerobaculia bacterium]|nr:serine/threonine-protein kinase [Thermoanaerobaculia bacterium]
MRDSRLFDTVVGYASELEAETPPGDTPDETEDPWRIEELESGAGSDPRLGQTLGGIRLDALVGQGGMGTVFEGWDEKLQRKVAVKAVSSRFQGNDGARERFLREARLLSKIQHPNICQIHHHIEGPDGDYLVLELIHGQSLRAVLEEGGRVPYAEAHGIASQLVAALIAAHDQGIAHRDLKPGNIMITPDGTVKVLDFGLALSVERAVEKGSARAGLQWTESGSIERREISVSGAFTDELDTGDLVDTRASHQESSSGPIEGTIAYMSPEQARSEPAGTAGDIYSLGLVLQHLFTGSGAYPPNLPLTNQLVRAGQGDTLPVKGVDPDLARLIERMKSVASGSRPSALDVAERLEWIRSKPARRRRTTAVAAFVLILAVFSVVMGYQRSRIAEEAARANREAESAKQVTEYLKGLFEVADPWNAESSNVTARELLNQGAEKIETELEEQPLIRAHLLGTIGDIHRRLGLYRDARPLLEESLELRRRHGAAPDEIATSLVWLGSLETVTGNHSESLPAFEEAIELYREHSDPDDPARQDAIYGFACAEHAAGNFETAVELFEETLTTRREQHGEESLAVADVLVRLGILYEELERDEAEGMMRQGVEIREKLLPHDHKLLGQAYGNLATHYFRDGQYARAVPMFRRDLEIAEAAYGPDHPDLTYGHNNLAAALRELGRLDEAEPHVLRTLEIQRSVFDDDHESIASGLSGLATLYRDQGKTDEARPLWEEALRIWRETYGGQHPFIAGALLNLAMLDQASGEFGDAAQKQRQAMPIYEAAFGEEHVRVAGIYRDLGRSLAGLGALDEAAQHLTHAVSLSQSFLDGEPEHPYALHTLANSLAALAEIEAQRNRPAEAEKSLIRAAAILEPLARDTEPVRYDLSLIEILVALGRSDEAEPLAKELLDKGFRRQEFVALCREQRWTG